VTVAPQLLLSNTMVAGHIKSISYFQSLLQPTWRRSAQAAAAEQEVSGDRETIEYEDDKGEWHTEPVSSRDRPHAIVKDSK
jgi:hypothetical protein